MTNRSRIGVSCQDASGRDYGKHGSYAAGLVPERFVGSSAIQGLAFLRPYGAQCTSQGPRRVQRRPSHISKTVLSTVHFGPPLQARARHGSRRHFRLLFLSKTQFLPPPFPAFRSGPQMLASQTVGFSEKTEGGGVLGQGIDLPHLVKWPRVSGRSGPQEVRPGGLRIVLEGFRREVTVSDLCRREGIKPGIFYSWTKIHGSGEGASHSRYGKRRNSSGDRAPQAGE